MKLGCLSALLASLALQGHSLPTEPAKPTPTSTLTVPAGERVSGSNSVKGWDNEVSGEGNAVEGKEQKVFGIGNYLRGLRNSVKGVGNVGIGESLEITGANNYGYGKMNKIEGL